MDGVCAMFATIRGACLFLCLLCAGCMELIPETEPTAESVGGKTDIFTRNSKEDPSEADRFIQVLAYVMGDNFQDNEDTEPLPFRHLPPAVIDAANQRADELARFNATIYPDAWVIFDGPQAVGYAVEVYYWNDNVDTDAGNTFYFNLDAELVVEVEWWE